MRDREGGDEGERDDDRGRRDRESAVLEMTERQETEEGGRQKLQRACACLPALQTMGIKSQAAPACLPAAHCLACSFLARRLPAAALPACPACHKATVTTAACP